VREADDGTTRIMIYSKNVSVEEIVPLVIKQKRCAKRVPNLAISWAAISQQMKTRSVDDLRNFWQLKLLPILVPATVNRQLNWTEEEDIDLIAQIYGQDQEREADLDFEDIENDKSAEENAYRWSILLKGLGGILPGQRFQVKDLCRKMIHDI